MIDGRACQYSTEYQLEQALATLAAARPVLDRGSAVRKHGYYFHLAMARVAQNRFLVDETDLDNARRSLAAALEAAEKDVGYATFFLARFLLLRGYLAAVHLEAGHLAEAVAATRRLRDHMQFPAGLEATLTAASQAWDQGQPDLAREYLTAALDLARDLGYV